MRKSPLKRRVNAYGCFNIKGHEFYVGRKYSGRFVTILRSATVLDPDGKPIEFDAVDTVQINLIHHPESNDPEKIRPLMDKVLARKVEERKRGFDKELKSTSCRGEKFRSFITPDMFPRERVNGKYPGSIDRINDLIRMSAKSNNRKRQSVTHRIVEKLSWVLKWRKAPCR